MYLYLAFFLLLFSGCGLFVRDCPLVADPHPTLPGVEDCERVHPESLDDFWLVELEDD